MTAPRVLLASRAGLPSAAGDEANLVGALAALGVDATWVAWDDPEIDFTAADLVVLRSTWDYPERHAEFLKWCESVPRLVNPARVARWNTDKSYLVDLAARGVDVIPTELIGPADDPAWPDAEFVLKPAVGAGSRGARRFRPDEHAAATEHLAALRAHGPDAVIQPYQAAVDREGEIGLVYVRGAYSHAFSKAPKLPSEDGSAVLDPSGIFTEEKLPLERPAADLLRVAEQSLDAACVVLDVRRADLLYARVDLVRDARGAPLVLELELTEPGLGFAQAGPAALTRFASAIRAGIAEQRTAS